MARRKVPLRTGFLYHVFNRGVEHRITFTNSREYKRALKTLSFYQYAKLSMRLSKVLQLEFRQRQEFLDDLQKRSQRMVDIICFCLMPNHFHLLLKQLSDNGISTFLGNFQNSYTRYFNTRNKRDGHLFKGNFKAVLVESDSQLIHLSRYIHLNPYSSAIVSDLNGLLSYPWSSLGEYLNPEERFLCQKEFIMSFFKDTKSYQKFLLDQADYQRKLESIKHLALE